MANSFALRPCDESTELILGVYGRALHRYPSIRLHALNPISSHDTSIISGSEPEEIPKFIGYVKNNVSREIRRLHDLPYAVFANKRAKVLPIAPDQASQEARLRYVLAQGTKEGLVESPREWPGVTGVHALEKGERLYGWWYDRTAEYKARRRGEVFDKRAFATEYEVLLSPLPSWADLSEDDWRARVTAIVDDIEELEARRRDGKPVLGIHALKAYSPLHIPDKVDKSPSPIVLAASRGAYLALRRFYDAFCKLFWEQSRRSRQAPEVADQFPPFSFPPARPMTGGPAIPLELLFLFALEPG